MGRFDDLIKNGFLNLEFVTFTVGDEEFRTIASMREITSLVMGRDPIGDKEIEHFRGNENIATLLLGAHNLSKNGFEVIATMKSLTTLDLGHSKIGDEDIKPLEENPTITSLHLGCGPWGEAGAISDAGAITISTMPHLAKLSLGINFIGDEGFEAIVSMNSLKMLYLGDNPCIGIEAIQTLVSNDNITTFILGDTPITSTHLGNNHIAPQVTVALHDWKERRYQDGNPVNIDGLDLSLEAVAAARSELANNILNGLGVKQNASGRTPGQ